MNGMNGHLKSWFKPVATVCAGLVLLAAGAAWALPGDLSGASDEALVAAVGGCSATAQPCHYTSACINNSYEGIPSTYFYYKYTSAQKVEVGGPPGTCREHKHYLNPNCVTYEASNYFDICGI
jgi:hypothetical protein